MRSLILGIAVVLALVGVACSPQAAPAPTPDLQATVQAQVKATVAALPDSAPAGAATTQAAVFVPTVPPPATQLPPVATQAPATPLPPPTATAVPPPTRAPDVFLEISSVTSPTRRGATATLKARTVPNSNCSIAVYYKSGPSSAKGLESKVADSSGNVAWSWTVGSNTTPGTWRIVVSASGNAGRVSRETTFAVQ